MIWLWLVLLGAVYVLIAVVAGKICAVHSRWERCADRAVPPPSIRREKAPRQPKASPPDADPAPEGGQVLGTRQ